MVRVKNTPRDKEQNVKKKTCLNFPRCANRGNKWLIHYARMMNSAQVVETSVNVTTNSPSRDNSEQDDQIRPRLLGSNHFPPYLLFVVERSSCAFTYFVTVHRTSDWLNTAPFLWEIDRLIFLILYAEMKFLVFYYCIIIFLR